ncbi:MAG: hypothetical protein AB1505_25110 [Candidatus Latescibacterota bacterium]
MGIFESVTMSVALALMFAAVAARILTAQLIARTKARIGQVAHVKQEAVSRLKQAEGRKAVAEQNKAKLLTRKTKLSKQRARLQEEIGKAEEEDSVRRQRAEMRRVE